MKLNIPIIEIAQCPTNILDYLKTYVNQKNWDNEDLLTKEEAFYDQSFRIEAVTDFFNENSFFYSKLPPSKQTSEDLKPYLDFLLGKLFLGYELFRCQVVCLHPGQNVYPHIDPRYYHTYGKRIHLPLYINDQSFHVHFRPEHNYDMTFSKMTEGIITDFDNITPHSAFNYGNSNRIHIICDIVEKNIVEKLRQHLNGNPNATDKKIVEEYYIHLKNIETKYQCNYKELKPFYIQKMHEYQQTTL